jgi:FixJ family two-component response regulator
VRRAAGECHYGRERKSLRELVEGKPSKVGASAFGVGEQSIDVHRANLMRKPGTRSVAGLV